MAGRLSHAPPGQLYSRVKCVLLIGKCQAWMPSRRRRRSAGVSLLTSSTRAASPPLRVLSRRLAAEHRLQHRQHLRDLLARITRSQSGSNFFQPAA